MLCVATCDVRRETCARARARVPDILAVSRFVEESTRSSTCRHAVVVPAGMVCGGSSSGRVMRWLSPSCIRPEAASSRYSNTSQSASRWRHGKKWQTTSFPARIWHNAAQRQPAGRQQRAEPVKRLVGMKTYGTLVRTHVCVAPS